jgi:RNA polymerase sigma-70 factor, ECF subfamily
VQAAIAALHSEAPTFDATDWLQIAALCGTPPTIAPSPVVDLNRAVAIAMADGPAVGLALIDELRPNDTLDRLHLFHAARADLLRRLDRTEEARDEYARALGLTRTAPERAFLERRIAELRTR